MYSVELMVKEHENILKMLDVMKKACCHILDGGEIVDDDFRKMIAFVRNYADKHHHGKEEHILFHEMSLHLGQIGATLIQHGMLVEHDLGRLHIKDLETALDQYKKEPKTLYKLGILAEAAGYVNLLERHIDKENKVVYTYAEKNLTQDLLQSIDKRVEDFEARAEKEGIQNLYLQYLQELTQKYA